VNPGTLVALACGVVVAYLNGANDVSKGIATLAGSGVTNYRPAILWGTVWTGIGGLASSVLSQAMVGRFGAGLLAQQSAATLVETLAVLLGVAACVGLATRLGLPVSTTHAIVGSVAGVLLLSWSGSGQLGGFGWQSGFAASDQSSPCARSGRWRHFALSVWLQRASKGCPNVCVWIFRQRLPRWAFP
jgi:phosphate/sulfate permease